MCLVTVCITTFNRKELIFHTIESILSQTYKEIEIIIVDDFSTDGTKEFIENYILNLDDRIKYLRHNKNKGLATARNTAINNAKGKYFTFCDDDDIWGVNFISLFIDQVKKYDSSYSFCASSISNDSTVEAIRSSFKDFLVLGYTPPVACQFYLTKTLIDIGGYDENITSGVDHDLWLILGIKNYNLVWVNQNIVNVNQKGSEARMTYNFDKRINGIKNSMKIWETRIGDNFGESFFSCFEKNYQYNTYKKFILFSLKRKDYSSILSYCQNLPKALFLSDIKRYLKSKFQTKKTLKHPTFNKCIKDSITNNCKIEIIRE